MPTMKGMMKSMVRKRERITQKQRQHLENLLKEIPSEFSDRLLKKYGSINSLTKAEAARLINTLHKMARRGR